MSDPSLSFYVAVVVDCDQLTGKPYPVVMRLTPETTVAEIRAWYKHHFPASKWMSGIVLTETT